MNYDMSLPDFWHLKLCFMAFLRKINKACSLLILCCSIIYYCHYHSLFHPSHYYSQLLPHDRKHEQYFTIFLLHVNLISSQILVLSLQITAKVLKNLFSFKLHFSHQQIYFHKITQSRVQPKTDYYFYCWLWNLWKTIIDRIGANS